ncbi:MAG: molybdopterin synthase sulfur carrier subunit [marine bacterium B5-7]|nr:MAG: molybdopterin synthase sulfur carrier subunit [marine bacterium B5-7]
MRVTVRFFAALRETIGSSEMTLDVGPDHDKSANARSIWEQATRMPPDPHVRVAINKTYADFDAPVVDGDEVAFFPPVTGG